MRARSPLMHALLALAAVWAALVTVSFGLASGDWVTAIRQSVTLVAIAGLLGYMAAAVDNLVEEWTGGSRSGSDRPSTGRFQPVRIRQEKPAPARRFGRRRP
ncbi:hypothetical protein BH23ACT9_BH23ACT9_38070 [soil metagenome]